MNAFEQGYRDFAEGQTINPYNASTSKYKDWELGFNKAYFRNINRAREDEARRGSSTVQGKEKV